MVYTAARSNSNTQVDLQYPRRLISHHRFHGGKQMIQSLFKNQTSKTDQPGLQNKYDMGQRMQNQQNGMCAQHRLRSDWEDAQAGLSLGWTHVPFCWFCHALAHISKLMRRTM